MRHAAQGHCTKRDMLQATNGEGSEMRLSTSDALGRRRELEVRGEKEFKAAMGNVQTSLEHLLARKSTLRMQNIDPSLCLSCLSVQRFSPQD